MINVFKLIKLIMNIKIKIKNFNQNNKMFNLILKKI